MMGETTATGGASWRERDDAALVEGMRAGDARAFAEFYARFQPLLAAELRRRGVALADGEEWLVETLTDAALRLADVALPRPHSLAAYLVVALRHRLANAWRDGARRLTREAGVQGSEPSDADGAAAGAAASSEGTRRYSRPADAEVATPSAALARLADALLRDLSESDRLLLVWVSHYVPQRQIAAWLGITHAAAKVRLCRLRRRLHERALRHAEAIDGEERHAVLRFLDRAVGETPRARSTTNGH
jgi:DNA-directed RNA polymerase specialized sigma24 family protein